MEQKPCKIGFRSQCWIAYHIQVREAGKAKCIADASASGTFQIKQDFGGLRDPHARIQRQDTRRGLFAGGLKTVLAGVFREEAGMLLVNRVDLPGDPNAGIVGMVE